MIDFPSPVQSEIAHAVLNSFRDLFGHTLELSDITINTTPKEYDGDFTIVTFPLARWSKLAPPETAEKLGAHLLNKNKFIASYNVIKGFLNLSLDHEYWMQFFINLAIQPNYSKVPKKDATIVIEYCGPNTNKPLHLGHVRNMLLGSSVSLILEANGYNVVRVNIYNDRGIAICKSMVAWQRLGEGATPDSSKQKGDHFVGAYYVKYDEILKQEIAELVATGLDPKEAAKKAPVYLEAHDMLRAWENEDPEVWKLWKQMNDWVYSGFEETYKALGIWFDKAYYESKTYLDGKSIVEEGLEKGVYFKQDDGSIWVDLTEDGLDLKVLIRSDGTAVYLTQDLGTAQHRYDDYKMDRSIYVVANEQDYHFKVLKLTLDKLGKAYSKGIYHLSYGMVELPSGRMKSREGDKVDADDLVDEMIHTAKQHTTELGKIEGLSEEEANELFQTIGLGALKYFILKVNPKKKILFDPKESIDFHGHTGPFIQYTYARIQSLLRKEKANFEKLKTHVSLQPVEIEILRLLESYPTILVDAGKNYDPAEIANFCFNLAKVYNKFYAEVAILKADAIEEKEFRLALSENVGQLIKKNMSLLGIQVPDKM